MTGWDFAALGTRLVADDPPWDFETTCAEAMAASTACLDMGTGGGERLSDLVRRVDSARRVGTGAGSAAAGSAGVGGAGAGSAAAGGAGRKRTVHASEGWRPNLDLATSALEEYGIDVREYDSETGEAMPWTDGFFDLVMNRHESYDPAELARVLIPNGRFLTQQVDGTEAGEFRQWFRGEPQTPDIRLEPCIDALESQGFTIAGADEWIGTMEFADVEAVIEYLAYIPWDVPDFTVADNLDTLDLLWECNSPISVTQKRFFIAAEL
ncbi:class I SAM-dependent methyltransferase [Brevibacterium marinum]|uniref:Methyltransferase domain-containing protein n=1 Tax=Brevibacterium marinum TaxID=418643 RepID=A0A846S0L9_9MICO|nr:class I SAM-dependent methyltransferase [Brevibacterium marinum]NJC55152.1 hypothetical protein [Brevibacterium marinum]